METGSFEGPHDALVAYGTVTAGMELTSGTHTLDLWQPVVIVVGEARLAQFSSSGTLILNFGIRVRTFRPLASMPM